MDMGRSMEMFLSQERSRGEDADPQGLMNYLDAVNTGFDVRVQQMTGGRDYNNLDRLFQRNTELPAATGMPGGTPVPF